MIRRKSASLLLLVMLLTGSFILQGCGAMNAIGGIVKGIVGILSNNKIMGAVSDTLSSAGEIGKTFGANDVGDKLSQAGDAAGDIMASGLEGLGIDYGLTTPEIDQITPKGGGKSTAKAKVESANKGIKTAQESTFFTQAGNAAGQGVKNVQNAYNNTVKPVIDSVKKNLQYSQDGYRR